MSDYVVCAGCSGANLEQVTSQYGGEYECPACNWSCDGFVYALLSDITALRATNARLVEALEEAERALEIARDCTSRPTIYNEAEAALAALRRARGERDE